MVHSKFSISLALNGKCVKIFVLSSFLNLKKPKENRGFSRNYKLNGPMCLCAVKGKGNPYIGRLVPCVHLKSGRAQDG